MLAASLASCTAITIEMYADRKEWELGEVEVAVDCPTRTPSGDATSFDVRIKVPAELTDEQRERILVIAGEVPRPPGPRRQDVEIDDTLEPLEA